MRPRLLDLFCGAGGAVGCGRIADRCAEPGCDSFGDHIDDDGTEWCQWHCPGAECVADREVAS